MDVKLLTSFVVRSLDDFSKAIVVQRDLMLNPAMANAEDSIEARVNLKFVEKQAGKKYVDFIMRTNSIMSAPGYTPKSDKRGHDYWKTVVYISTAELDGLLARLDDVYKAAKNSDYINREPYVNAFKGIVRAMIPDISDERLNAMSQEEIMAQVVGLNASTQTTSKHTLQEIVNPKVVDTQEYSDMVRTFAIKYNALQSVKTSNYPFKLAVNRVTYYWIPTDMIP